MEGSLACPRYPSGRANFSYISSLRFSKTRELWSSNAAFAIAFCAAVNHNYDHKQQTMKTLEHTKRIEFHQSQNMNFWTRRSKLLFLKRSTKMINGSEERKRQLLLNFRIRVFSVKSAVKDEVSDYMTNTKVGSARFTLLAGLTLLQINTMPRPAGSTRSRHDNQSMREQPCFKQPEHARALLSQAKVHWKEKGSTFFSYKRLLKLTR